MRGLRFRDCTRYVPEIKRCCEGEGIVLVNVNVEVDDEPSDYYI